MTGHEGASTGSAARVHLLGPVQLVIAGASVGLTGKERRLLALLALHPGVRVSEDQLIDALWEADPPRTARRTLQANVSRLRRALAGGGDHLRIETADSGYQLAGADLSTDADHAERLRADAATRSVEVACQLLTRAEGLWRGNSLGHLAEEPAFTAAAGRLDALRIAIIEDRVTAELAAGRHLELVAELADLTDRYPLHERLWEAWMLALYRAGQQSQALRVYQQLRTVLGQGLGIDPSPQVTELEAAILRHEPTLRWSAREEGVSLGVPLPRVVDKDFQTPCMGRSGELDRLGEAWELCLESRPTVVLLAGAPGVGKTRLAVELARRAHTDGATVLYGSCDEGIVAPYQPFVEGLAHLVAGVEPAALAGLLGPGGRELRHLIPELAAASPDLPERTVSEPETERFRLFSAVTEWVETIARTAPVLFVLDDLHWAGSATLLLAHHLVSHLGDVPVCIVATYRDTELHTNPSLVDLLAALRRREQVVRIALDGLDATGCQQLVRAVTGTDLVDPGHLLADTVYRQTEGNPFFVHEVLRHLVDTGLAVTATDGRWIQTATLAPEVLPEGVREVVRRRLSLLPSSTREALAVASVIGQEFRFDLLAAVIGADGLPEAIQAATDARLIDESSDARALRFRFTHALVQATIYHDLGGVRRTELHARVAEELAARPGSHLHQLAFHYVRAAPAGYTVEALAACGAAADQAMAELAFEAAAGHCRSGLDLLDPSEDVSTDRAALLVGLAEAQFRIGDPEYRANLEAAWRLTAQLGDLALARRAALACSRGYWGNFVAVDQGRVAALELALGLSPHGDGQARSRLQADLAAELIWDPGQDRVAELSDEALAVARRSGDIPLLATVIARRLTTFWELDRSAERQALAIEGLALATDLGDPVLQAQFATYGLFCAVESADATRLDSLRDLAEELAPTLGQPVWEYSIHYAMMTYYSVRGGPKELQAWSERALDLGTRLGLPEAPFLAVCETADLHWWRDTYEEIVDAVEAIVGEYEELATMRTWMAAILARTGRPEPAQRILDGFVATGFDVGRDHSQGIALAECALAAADLGDRRAAAPLLDVLEPYRGLVLRNPINAAGPTEWFLARLHDTLGDHQAADADFAEAVAISERMEAGMWLAHIHCDWAEATARRPHRAAGAAARRLATLALVGAEELDLTGIARRARKLVESGS